jgi:hypothetical protein
MIKHIVMWKLKDFAEGGTKAENARKIKQLLEGLKDSIKEIRRVEVGLNISAIESIDAFDVVLNIEFDNVEDLKAYQKHPEHLRVGDFIGKVRLERKVVDYEV